MNIVLRKYFWTINLLTITLCAAFASTAVGKLVESKIRRPSLPRITPPPLEQKRAGNEPPARDITDILERNMFCSTCKKVQPGPLHPSQEGGSTPPAADAPVKTSLNLKLLATLTSEEDKAWSFAAILDDTEGAQGLFSIGSRIAGDAVVTDIMACRVLLINNGQREYLDLLAAAEQQPGIAGPPLSPTVTARGRPTRPTPLRGLEQIASGIRKVGEGKYEIRRSVLNKMLENTALFDGSPRIVPSVLNGKPNGFKIYAVRPGSPYSLLGMFNGDNINAINGHALTTPTSILELFTKLRHASHFSVAFTRRGKPLTHDYNIR